MVMILMNLELGWSSAKCWRCCQNGDVFSHWPDDVGCTVKHCITGSVSPIWQQHSCRGRIKAAWRHQGLTEQSTSTWASPVVSIKKWEWSWRFSVDYIKKTTTKCLHERLTLRWWYPWNLRWHVMVLILDLKSSYRILSLRHIHVLVQG